MAKFKLRLTGLADRHLEDLYLDGIQTWGEAQADRYYADLLSHLDLLLDNPFLYVAVDYIKPGYRRSVCGAHSIYYRVEGNYVEIVGIIKHQNPTKL